jgi:hypothetical protein
VTRYCYRDQTPAEDDAAVLVGVIEQGSGPGIWLYACPSCAVGLLPLAEHPADSDGTPRARGGLR